MKSTQPRSFSSFGKVSKKALTWGVALSGVIAVTAAVVARAGEPKREDVALDAARQVLTAVSEWQSENGSGCPTVSALIDDGKLDEGASVDDAWGNRFRVVCEGKDTSVRSAGPDGKLGTADDVRVTRPGE